MTPFQIGDRVLIGLIDAPATVTQVIDSVVWVERDDLPGIPFVFEVHQLEAPPAINPFPTFDELWAEIHQL